MSEKETQAAGAEVQTKESDDLLESMLRVGLRAKDDREADWGKQLLKDFVKSLLDPKMVVEKNTRKTIELRIKQIDELLSAQTNEIMHHPDFQKLEGSWRGLHYLVHKSETGTRLKIRVLNTSKRDLLEDLENATEFDQSMLFQRVYEDEYGMLGGTPYGTLIGDYEFSNHPQDLALLERVAQVASAAHAPFISAASPEMFRMDSFTKIRDPRDLAKIFDTAEYATWKAFRMSEDSRYTALTLPRVLARLPYGKKTRKVEAFDFEEEVDQHDKYAWMNSAWAYGARITAAFAKDGWLARIRGVEGGGMVEGLPTHTFKTIDGEIAMKCPTEIGIPDRREKEFSDLGFIALCHAKNTNYAAFIGGQSVQSPKVYDVEAGTANAELSTKINYILCVSRFAHFLKAMARDKLGSFMERDECEAWLQRWINRYILANPKGASDQAKAERPLAAAKVEVREVAGKPGYYEAKCWLRPHFQLEGLTTSMSLVARLPPSKG